MSSRPPTFVFAGEFWQGASGKGISNGLQALGCLVQEVENRSFSATMHARLPIRLMNRLVNPLAKIDYLSRILDTCRDLRPDYFITIKGTYIDQETLDRISEMGIRRIIYYPDYHFNHNDMSRDTFSKYDLFITTKSFQVEFLRNLLSNTAVYYIPHGYSDGVHRPIYDFYKVPFRSETSFVGNHSEYKESFLSALLAAKPGVNLAIVGAGWGQTAKRMTAPQVRISKPRMGLAYAETIQTARISIAIHNGPDSAGWQDLVSTRTFEIPACGGFMLHIDNQEVREFYTPGREIDVFDSPEELADKISFYENRPDTRLRMVESAYARCVPNYSYTNVAKQILSLL